MLGLSRYQWTVLFAAWLGWGFDVFDGLLFNYVAPNCVPTLLNLPIGSPEAKQATLFWTGLLTSVLLLGWAVGGILFGLVCDRIGRRRTLLLTMTMYAVGTAACAFAPNIWVLLVFRIIASLGIGGEWAAGASMVAEVVPENKRVTAGALLYTSAPMGLFLATFVNLQVAGHWLADQPEVSWRYVFLFGLIPVAAASVVRVFLKEPERWKQVAAAAAPPRLVELFGPEYRRITISGVMMAVVALLTWWSCNAFIPVVVSHLAQTEAASRGLDRSATLALVENWKYTATACFNLGGLVGTLLTIPIATHMGRRPMFGIYFAASALSIFVTFSDALPAVARLYMYAAIGISVFGVFGSFTYYLPELFPTRLRATGSGFCYNVGRVIAAGGPFLVGVIASQGASSAVQILFWVGVIPAVGVLLTPWVIETRGRLLAD
ncbi:MFS transporter [Sinimarinibacterium sp. CAU 1509]|uniref:MFS transporter n=1 Tax=Sinimarinibacterium sp. CAU 1509 TaxID=2562283 RepID=UPI0010AD5BD7|nr:MFS transporter [Sinimarinibacterium sp. CAU 1509]TJY59936.1 MFS transporter [Sinimarinibacterium sp. CAU 1509]